MSKALEMSKKVPLTSSDELQPNDLRISWVIDSNWEIHESPGKKPDRLLVNNLFFIK